MRFRDLARSPDSGIEYRGAGSARLTSLRELLGRGELRLLEDLPRLPGKPYGAPGVAIFDFDRDGDLDIYAANGRGAANSLYASRLRDRGELRFVDAAERAGVAARDQDSTGVCYGDLDNDGDHDLLVLGAADSNLLFENRLESGKATFADVTENAGLGSGGLYSTSCSMGDVDGDGLLDVAVANSYDWSSSLGLLVPFVHNQPNQLFLNRGGNVFEDVSESSGFRKLAGLPPEHRDAAGVTWAIAVVDVDLDGDADIVSLDNRGSRAAGNEAQHGLIHLHRNDGRGRFTDVALDAGLDLASAWLGVSFGDFNGDHLLDFFATNAGDYPPSFHPPGLVLEVGKFSSRWFLGRAGGGFDRPGLGPLAATVSGWGTSAFDYDNDGDTDVVYHGGLYSGFFLDAGNPGVVLRNRSAAAGFVYDGRALAGRHSRRNVQGVASGDLDEDGRVDVVSVSSFDIPESVPLTPNPTKYGSPFDATSFMVVTHRPGPAPGVLLGERVDFAPGSLAVEVSGGGAGNGWIEVELAGSAGLLPGGRVNRDALGAVVFVSTPSGARTARPIVGGASYGSQDTLRSHFGLGSDPHADLEVLWPGGRRSSRLRVAAGERLRIPEVPCDPGEAPAVYRRCLGEALDALVSAAALDGVARRRYLASARHHLVESPETHPTPPPGDDPR